MAEQLTGIDKLKAAVMRDCAGGDNCFSENGCTKERYKHVPQDDPNMLKYDMKTKCVSQTKCFHDYCGKYKWVLDKAKEYADKIGITPEAVIEEWEADRNYWYMNYYQEAKQPAIDGPLMRYEDWQKELRTRFGDDPKQWAFKCPACGNTQRIADFELHGIDEPEAKVTSSCIGRHVKGIGCNWTLGGLLQIHKQHVLRGAIVFPVFEMGESTQEGGSNG